MEEAKPQCGSEAGSTAEYPMTLHVGGLFLVLTASCLGAGFPVAAKKLPFLKIPPKIFFACKHFGTGVLIATAFVHLLPTAFGSLMNPCLPDLFIENYPAMPGVIMMASMLALFCVELYLNAKTGGHSHGGPTGETAMPAQQTQVHAHAHAQAPQRPPPSQQSNLPAYYAREDPQRNPTYQEVDDAAYEKAMLQKIYEKNAANNGFPFQEDDEDDKRSTMPAWFVVFYEQYVRHRAEMLDMINNTRTVTMPYDNKTTVEVTNVPFDEENQAVDPAVLRKMSLNITLLEGGILFHSVFVGITIAMTTDGLAVLLTAIVFHQMFEGLGLGSRIAAVPYPKGSIRPWLLVFAFGTTAPIGQAIGILSRNSYDPESALGLILNGTFNAISSGLLIYAALVNLLVEDFLSEEAQHLLTKRDKIKALVWVFLGAAGMSIVGAFA
ncbi:hypothetical protein ACJ41O_014370 [Fusarium nematophilum]